LKNNEWNDQWGVSDLANPFYLKAPGHAASVQLIAAKQQRDAKKTTLTPFQPTAIAVQLIRKDGIKMSGETIKYADISKIHISINRHDSLPKCGIR